MEYRDTAAVVIAYVMKFMELINFVGALITMAVYLAAGVFSYEPLINKYSKETIPALYGFSMDLPFGELVHHETLFAVAAVSVIAIFVVMTWAFHLLYRALMTLGKVRGDTDQRGAVSVTKDLRYAANLMLALFVANIVMTDVILVLQDQHLVPAFSITQVSYGWLMLSLVVYGLSKHIGDTPHTGADRADSPDREISESIYGE